LVVLEKKLEQIQEVLLLEWSFNNFQIVIQTDIISIKYKPPVRSPFPPNLYISAPAIPFCSYNPKSKRTPALPDVVANIKVFNHLGPFLS
jgi:hypothetical protein